MSARSKMCRVVCGEAWGIAGGGDGGAVGRSFQVGCRSGLGNADGSLYTFDARRVFPLYFSRAPSNYEPAAVYESREPSERLFSCSHSTFSFGVTTMSDYEDEMDVDAPAPDTSIVFGGDSRKGKRSAANLPVEAEDSLPWYGEGAIMQSTC